MQQVDSSVPQIKHDLSTKKSDEEGNKIYWKNLKSIQRQIEYLCQLNLNNPDKGIQNLTTNLAAQIEEAQKNSGLRKYKKDYIGMLTSLKAEVLDIEKVLFTNQDSFNMDEEKNQITTTHNHKWQDDPLEEPDSSELSTQDSIENKTDTIDVKKQEELSTNVKQDVFSLWPKELKKQSFKKFIKNFLIFKQNADDTLSECLPKIEHLREKINRYCDLEIPSKETLDNAAIRAEKVIPNQLLHNSAAKSIESQNTRVESHKKLLGLLESITIKMDMIFFYYFWVTIYDKINSINLKKQIVEVKRIMDSEFKGILKAFNTTCMNFYTPPEIQLKEDSFESFKKCQDIFISSNAIPDIKKKINDLKSAHSTLRVKLIEILTKISSSQKKLESNYEGFLTEFNESPRKLFTDQKENAINQLQLLKSQLITDWNNSCFNLEKMLYDLDFLEKTINLEMNMGKCYVSAKEIYQCLPKISETEKSRDIQQLKFDNYKKTFFNMCEYIDKRKKEVADPDKKIIYDQPNSEFKCISGHTMRSLFERTIDLLNENSIKLVELFSPDVNFIELTRSELLWDNITNPPIAEEADPALIIQFKAFWKKQHVELSNYINQTHTFYNMLEPLYKNAAEELNRVGKTLAIKSLDYDQDFTKAYSSKNPVVRAVGSGATKLGEKASTLIHEGKEYMKPSPPPDAMTRASIDLEQHLISQIPDHKTIYPPKFES